MKAIKTNSGSTGVISNMVPSLQHICAVSILLGKVEYVAGQNVYDGYERKRIIRPDYFLILLSLLVQGIFSFDVEEKWKRLRLLNDRQCCLLPSQTQTQIEELEIDATSERSKSAYYYIFNRV